eukprot:scaffold660482_cov43-Attheya_sp.AAC.1
MLIGRALIRRGSLDRRRSCHIDLSVDCSWKWPCMRILPWARPIPVPFPVQNYNVGPSPSCLVWHTMPLPKQRTRFWTAAAIDWNVSCTLSAPAASNPLPALTSATIMIPRHFSTHPSRQNCPLGRMRSTS